MFVCVCVCVLFSRGVRGKGEGAAALPKIPVGIWYFGVPSSSEKKVLSAATSRKVLFSIEVGIRPHGVTKISK